MRNAARMRMVMLTVVALALAGPALAGTMFRLEIGQPIAGGDFKVKNAVLVVRPVVCDDVAGVKITATVEGMVNGVRQSQPVKLLAMPTPGVYAVQRQWPEGHWVLHLSGTCPAPAASASTIVPLTKTGFVRSTTQVLREPGTAAQVDAAVMAVVRASS